MSTPAAACGSKRLPSVEESLHHFCGLLEIFVSRAPEEETSRDFSEHYRRPDSVATRRMQFFIVVEFVLSGSGSGSHGYVTAAPPSTYACIKNRATRRMKPCVYFYKVFYQWPYKGFNDILITFYQLILPI
jgi:hypothetical protein